MSRVDELFDLECELRSAAVSYAQAKTEDNRKELRRAAIAYANHADDLGGFEIRERPQRKSR
jgi:hypothetical protein